MYFHEAGENKTFLQDELEIKNDPKQGQLTVKEVILAYRKILHLVRIYYREFFFSKYFTRINFRKQEF